jgi:DNA (cytosine-5)-methyltransferase 1
MQTITAKHGYAVVTPFLIQYHNYDDTARGQNLEKPILTVDTSNRYGLVAAFLAKHYGGNYKGAGAGMDESVPTVTTVDHNALAVAHLTKFQQNSIGQVPTEPIHTVMAGATRFGLVSSHIVKLKGTNIGHKTDEPLHTITSGGLHFGEVRAFLLKYYGADIGQTCHNPLHTVTLKDRFGLVTVQGEEYQIADIGMRMLQPRELFDAQGFPHDYIIDRDADGKPYPKSAQVARCGNSVCPPVVAVLVKANLPELCAQDEDVERTG